jgi:hypothetical protein
MMDDIRLTLNASIVLRAHMHIVILLYLGYIPKLLISGHKWFKSRVASNIPYLWDFGNSSHK